MDDGQGRQHDGVAGHTPDLGTLLEWAEQLIQVSSCFGLALRPQGPAPAVEGCLDSVILQRSDASLLKAGQNRLADKRGRARRHDEPATTVIPGGVLDKRSQNESLLLRRDFVEGVQQNDGGALSQAGPEIRLSEAGALLRGPGRGEMHQPFGNVVPDRADTLLARDRHVTGQPTERYKDRKSVAERFPCLGVHCTRLTQVHAAQFEHDAPQERRLPRTGISQHHEVALLQALP